MRKYILVLLLLGGIAAAQRLKVPKVPLLHRDHSEAERTALNDKLTKLAETRTSLGMPAVQPSSAAELDALTDSAQPKRPASRVAKKRVVHNAAAKQSAWPPPSQAWAAGEQEPSLGEVARKYRAQKRRAHSSGGQ